MVPDNECRYPDLDRSVFEIGKIAGDRIRQPLRATQQILGAGQNAGARLLDPAGDGRDLWQHARNSVGDPLGAVTDAIDFRGLMIENAAELPMGIVHHRHARRNAGDRLHRFVHGVLNVVNLRADVAGGLGGLLRERLDLGSDDGEALARRAGARGLDCRVQCEQRGLRGDRFNQLDHHADAVGGRGEASDGTIGARQVADRTVGRVLGERSFGFGLLDQSEQFARRIRDRGHVAARHRSGLDRLCGAFARILIARAEIGGGDADFLTRRLEDADKLVGSITKALGEEAAAVMAEPRLSLPATVIDRERVGVDQHLPHRLSRGGAVGQRSTADPFRQRSIAVAAGDLCDRVGDGAQCPLARPSGCNRTDERRGNAEKQTPRKPGHKG